VLARKLIVAATTLLCCSVAPIAISAGSGNLPSAAAAQSRVITGSRVPPLPETIGPLRDTRTSYPWDAAAHGLTPIDLRAHHYVEQEYLMKGVADVYSGTTGGPLTVDSHGPYETRILIRRPANPRDFSGRVIVELNNPTSNYDVDIVWAADHNYFMASHDIYLGISIKPVVLQAMKKFDPKRYAGLSMANPDPSNTCPQGSKTTETGLAWDMISQLGALLRSHSHFNPLRNEHVQDVYLSGYSQSGGYMITYINDIVPHYHLAHDAPIYDGYLIAAGYGFTELAPINQCATPAVPGTPGHPEEPGVEQFVVHPPKGVPVIDVQTLSDSYSFFGWAGLQRDSDTRTDRYQLYQIPGASHIWAYQVEFTPGPAELVRAGYPADDWKDNCLDPINPFPLQYFMDAAFANLDRWVRRGIAPPPAPLIAAEGGGTPGATMKTDSNGNAEGGVRNPYVDVPIATYYGTTPGEGTCELLWGHWAPFSSTKLHQLYPTHADYVARVRRDAEKDVRERFLTPMDATAIVAQAEKARVP
jgi:hypothetical protein